MDVWQSADPSRKMSDRLDRPQRAELADDKRGNVPVMQIGPNRLPLALQGAPSGVVSINNKHALPPRPGRQRRRPPARPAASCSKTWPSPSQRRPTDDLLQFVQRRAAADLHHAGPPAGGAARQPERRLRADRRPVPATTSASAEAAAGRPADRQGLRHACLLRHARRLRHALQPGRSAQARCSASSPTASPASSRRSQAVGPRQARAG